MSDMTAKESTAFDNGMIAGDDQCKKRMLDYLSNDYAKYSWARKYLEAVILDLFGKKELEKLKK